MININVIWSIAYLAAGGCLFVWLMNRYFIDFKASPLKGPVILLVVLSTLVLPAAAGWLIEGPYRAAFPILVLTGALIGEAHRFAMRRRHRGAEPVARENGRISLARPFTTTDLAVSHYAVEAPDWHGPNVRIAHVSDFHVNPHLTLDFYRDVIQRALAAKPDFLFVTGDFVSKAECLPLLEKVLPPMASAKRAYAVLGNHDYWSGAEAVSAVVRRAGLELLVNEHRAVDFGGGRVVITGCDDPWGPQPWSAPERRPGDLLLVLSHTPDNIYRLAKIGADAVFSGHLHAGQFRIPCYGAIGIPSIYGRRFDHGHFIVEGTHLFVTAGVGANWPPFRVYCPPDIFIVDIARTGSR